MRKRVFEVSNQVGHKPDCAAEEELFDLLLYFILFYVNGKQLRSCRDGQLLNHTVPGQDSQKQFTSI